jgi:hypothetical protein
LRRAGKTYVGDRIISMKYVPKRDRLTGVPKGVKLFYNIDQNKYYLEDKRL